MISLTVGWGHVKLGYLDENSGERLSGKGNKTKKNPRRDKRTNQVIHTHHTRQLLLLRRERDGTKQQNIVPAGSSTLSWFCDPEIRKNN